MTLLSIIIIIIIIFYYYYYYYYYYSKDLLLFFFIIINEKINVAFSRRTARTRNSHTQNTSRENVVSNSTEEEKIVMKMTARRAVSSAAA